jgi:hypothetical protein
MEKGRTKKRVQDLSMQRNYHHTWWEVNPRNQVVNEEKLLAVIAAFASEKRNIHPSSQDGQPARP